MSELQHVINNMDIYTTKGTSSPILRRSEEDRVTLRDMKTYLMIRQCKPDNCLEGIISN